MKYIIISLILAVAAARAYCLTGLEFYKYGVINQVEILKPIVEGYVEREYTCVPNEFRLREAINNLIRKDGLATNEINSIALSAAIELGMKTAPNKAVEGMAPR